MKPGGVLATPKPLPTMSPLSGGGKLPKVANASPVGDVAKPHPTLSAQAQVQREQGRVMTPDEADEVWNIGKMTNPREFLFPMGVEQWIKDTQSQAKWSRKDGYEEDARHYEAGAAWGRRWLEHIISPEFLKGKSQPFRLAMNLMKNDGDHAAQDALVNFVVGHKGGPLDHADYHAVAAALTTMPARGEDAPRGVEWPVIEAALKALEPPPPPAPPRPERSRRPDDREDWEKEGEGWKGPNDDPAAPYRRWGDVCRYGIGDGLGDSGVSGGTPALPSRAEVQRRLTGPSKAPNPADLVHQTAPQLPSPQTWGEAAARPLSKFQQKMAAARLRPRQEQPERPARPPLPDVPSPEEHFGPEGLQQLHALAGSAPHVNPLDPAYFHRLGTFDHAVDQIPRPWWNEGEFPVMTASHTEHLIQNFHDWAPQWRQHLVRQTYGDITPESMGQTEPNPDELDMQDVAALRQLGPGEHHQLYDPREIDRRIAAVGDHLNDVRNNPEATRHHVTQAQHALDQLQSWKERYADPEHLKGKPPEYIMAVQALHGEAHPGILTDYLQEHPVKEFDPQTYNAVTAAVGDKMNRNELEMYNPENHERARQTLSSVLGGNNLLWRLAGRDGRSDLIEKDLKPRAMAIWCDQIRDFRDPHKRYDVLEGIAEDLVKQHMPQLLAKCIQRLKESKRQGKPASLTAGLPEKDYSVMDPENKARRARHEDNASRAAESESHVNATPYRRWGDVCHYAGEEAGVRPAPFDPTGLPKPAFKPPATVAAPLTPKPNQPPEVWGLPERPTPTPTLVARRSQQLKDRAAVLHRELATHKAKHAQMKAPLDKLGPSVLDALEKANKAWSALQPLPGGKRYALARKQITQANVEYDQFMAAHNNVWLADDQVANAELESIQRKWYAAKKELAAADRAISITREGRDFQATEQLLQTVMGDRKLNWDTRGKLMRDWKAAQDYHQKEVESRAREWDRVTGQLGRVQVNPQFRRWGDVCRYGEEAGVGPAPFEGGVQIPPVARTKMTQLRPPPGPDPQPMDRGPAPMPRYSGAKGRRDMARPAPPGTVVHNHGPGLFRASFAAGGAPFEVNFKRQPDGQSWSLEFEKITSQGRTMAAGGGTTLQAVQVFNNVKALAKHYFSKYKPSELSFTAALSEPSRVKLYQFLARKFGKEFGYGVGVETTHWEWHTSEKPAGYIRFRLTDSNAVPEKHARRWADVCRYASAATEKKAAVEWVQERGERGATRWRNIDTGEVTYTEPAHVGRKQEPGKKPGVLRRVATAATETVKALAKDLATAIMHDLEPHERKHAAAVAKVATAVVKAGKDIEHKLEGVYKRTQAIARQAARERGLSEQHVEKVGRILAVADAVSRWGPNIPVLHQAIETMHLMGGPAAFFGAKAAYFVPVASVVYLASSTVKNPLATLRAAHKVIGHKSEIERHGRTWGDVIRC